MSRIVRNISEIMGLGLLLLMSIALAAGETDATADARAEARQGPSVVVLADQFQRNFDIQLGERALSIGIALAMDLSPFRGEDE